MVIPSAICSIFGPGRGCAEAGEGFVSGCNESPPLMTRRLGRCMTTLLAWGALAGSFRRGAARSRLALADDFDQPHRTTKHVARPLKLPPCGSSTVSDRDAIAPKLE